MTRKVCVVTGSRADYGHLASVMAAVAGHPQLTLLTMVTGQHLDSRFGDTWTAIAKDGFIISEKVDLSIGLDTPLETAEVVGRGVGAIARSFERMEPDIVVVLGDRFEILAAAQAAFLLNIPLAHIHGGEVTEAAMDDAIRHAITKMSHLHFCATKLYARRVRQMGENPDFVNTVGSPGLDRIATLNYLSRDELARDLNIDLSGQLFLITYHPVTLRLENGRSAVEALMLALSKFPNAAMVFTGVNSDPGNRVISDSIAAFVADNSSQCTVVKSLGQRRYLSAMREANAVIGNSSSGLIEAPALGVPTVNIGDRQKGRLKGASVIDCLENEGAINSAICQALDPAFMQLARTSAPPYGIGGASEKIASVLAEVDLSQLRSKPFYDIIEYVEAQ